jgi:hypothetical protein
MRWRCGRGLALALSLIACVSAPSRAARAYRTASDSSEFEGAGRVAWRAYSVHFQLEPAAAGAIPEARLRAAVGSAMGAWNAAPCSGLMLSLDPASLEPLAAAPRDGRNTIALVSSLPARASGAGDTLAFTDVRYAWESTGSDAGPWEIVEADIYLDATALLATGADLDATLREVLGHEFGHSAGLWHACSIDASGEAPPCSDGPAQALMDPRYQGAVPGPRTDDIAGVCALYPPTCLTSCAAGQTCTLAGCRVACGLSACELGERCEAEVCVPEAPACEGASCPALGLAGDPCAGAVECVSGYCDPDLGACEDRCVRGECGPRHACESRGEARVCVSDAGALGAECVECASGLCALRGAESGYCTRECDASCPDGFGCQDVDGRRVCARRAGGCAVAAPGSGRGVLPHPLGVALMIMAFVFGRSRRRRA